VINTPADHRKRKTKIALLIILIIVLIVTTILTAKLTGVDDIELKPENFRDYIDSWLDRIKIPGLDNG